MKNKLWMMPIVAVIGLMCLSFSVRKNVPGYFVNDIQYKTAAILEEKYQIRPIGYDVSMEEEKVRQIAISFTTGDFVAKERLREILVNGAATFLEQVNSHKEVQPYLENGPFNISNVSIILYNLTKNGFDITFPEVSTAECSNGKLIYRSYDSSHKLQSQVKETYEEALKILKPENSKNSKNDK